MSLKVSAVETLLNTQYVLFSGKTDILNSKKKTKLSVICTVPALYRSSPTSRNGPSKIMFNFWLSIFNIYSESILDLVSNGRTQWPVTAEVQNRKLFAFKNMQFKYNIKYESYYMMAHHWWPSLILTNPRTLNPLKATYALTLVWNPAQNIPENLHAVEPSLHDVTEINLFICLRTIPLFYRQSVRIFNKKGWPCMYTLLRRSSMRV